MIIVAVVKDGVVVNMTQFADEDADMIESFDYEAGHGEGAYGVIVENGVFAAIGYLYSDGEFSAPPAPEPTHQELVQQAENERQNRLTSADSIFLEWQTKLLLNIATDDEKSAVIAWVNYKDAVRAVDTNEAPDIDWPEQPPIPETAQ